LVLASECIPCLLNQVIRTYRILNYNDDEIYRRLRDAIAILKMTDWNLTPPEIYFKIYYYIRSETGIDDPYKHVKKFWSSKLRSYEDKFRNLIVNSRDPIYTALKLSLAGNIVDFGALGEFNIDNTIRESLSKPLTIDHYEIFKRKLEDARTLFYVLDNVGESIFDRLFLEILCENIKFDKIYIGIKMEPFINDVTYEDALEEGFDKLGNVEFIEFPVDTELFRRYRKKGLFEEWFKKADLTIMKGQGNLELFYKFNNIFFALMTKCNPVAKFIGVDRGSLIFKYQG